MSVSRRNTRRGRTKPQEETSYSIVASIKMLGISFANDISDVVDKTEALTQNPTVTLKGTKAIFDYGHITNQDDIDAINFLFQNVLSVDDTITVSDATHVNPLAGDTKEYDIAGTYTFSKYDPTSKIAILNQVSINNKSSTYDKYDYRYFTNSETLKFTTESTQTTTEERRIILNLLGAESENSFLLGFRELHIGDILSIQGVKGDFTVAGYRINNKNEEEIEVQETVSDTDLFGESTLVTLKRRVTEDDSSIKLFYPPEVTEDETPDEEEVREVPTPSQQTRTSNEINTETRRSVQPISGLPVPTSPPTFRNTRRDAEVSNIEAAKEKWLNGSRETIYVKVSKNPNDPSKNVFYIKGKVTDHKWSYTHTIKTFLTAGETYRFAQTDRTNKNHPIQFSFTRDGTHEGGTPLSATSTNKAPGSSSSYVYFTVPNLRDGYSWHIYCKNHPGMGFRMGENHGNYENRSGGNNNPEITNYDLDLMSVDDRETYLRSLADPGDGLGNQDAPDREVVEPPGGGVIEACVLDQKKKHDRPDRPPGFGDDFKDWVAQQMKCCKCLLFAEAGGEAYNCRQCALWVMYNRQKDDIPGGPRAIPGTKEADYCKQASMPGTWEGGCGTKRGEWQCNPSYRKCWCDQTQGEINDNRIKELETECKKLGINNFRGLPDPTGGANYLFNCAYLANKPDHYMHCNIKHGRCKKVQGACAGCRNCFFVCSGVPQPCDYFKNKTALITDPTDPYLEDIPGIQSDPGPAGGGAYG